MALELSWGWLEKLDLTDLAETLGDRLPASRLPLALFALHISKEPDLFFLERPKRSYGRNFGRIWEILLAEKEKRNLTVIVFDRQADTYREEIRLGLTPVF
jgi:hypothetical protein